MLASLSHSNNFSLLEFPISSHHLYTDGIHVLHRFNYLLTETLHQHIHRLIPSLTTPHSNQLPTPLVDVIETTPVIPPNTTSILTSSTHPSSPNHYAHVDVDILEINIPSDEELDPVTSTQLSLGHPTTASKSSHRSAETKRKRNKKRHEQQKQQYKTHPLRRRIHSTWSILETRDYLTKHNIPFGCVNPRRDTVVTILFRDEEQRQYADAQLPGDIFDEFHHTQWIINHPQK